MILHNKKDNFYQLWDDRFDKNYFENGVVEGISLYENYRWRPEITIPMANRLVSLYPNSSFLDFGCAKGFLVKALRLLGVHAYGYDVSKYAISSSGYEIKQYLYGPDDCLPIVDICFVKDVLEHISHDELDTILYLIRSICSECFVIVPFGENNKYRIDEYDLDKTHIIKKSEGWWDIQFINAGFEIKNFCYQMKGFKDNWSKHFYGNGFYFLY